MSESSITPFEWKHIEHWHYECNWHGFRLTANPDLWRIEWNGFTRQGAPRVSPGIRISARVRAKASRANAEAAAYRQFLRGGQGDEQ